MAYLEVKNLSYQVNGQSILQNISFSLAAGEILVIIGPNGSGKTTLLKHILGLIKAKPGQVLIAGREPRHALGKIAYVPQKLEFDRLTPITVQEFMELERCQIERHACKYIKETLAKVGLAGKESKLLGVLSGGELQRLMVARALLHEKELLILDEPLAGVDLAGESTIYNLIAEINKKTKSTCLIVSHELSVVYKYADNVLCLNKSLVCYGKPQVAINEETLSALYGTKAGLYHNH